jgi:hypothetical protein
VRPKEWARAWVEGEGGRRRSLNLQLKLFGCNLDLPEIINKKKESPTNRAVSGATPVIGLNHLKF